MGYSVVMIFHLSSSWRPPLRGLDDAPMDRGALSGAGRGGGEGSPGIFPQRGFLQKNKEAKTRKSNKRKNFGETPAAGPCPCPEPDGVRLHRFKASEARKGWLERRKREIV